MRLHLDLTSKAKYTKIESMNMSKLCQLCNEVPVRQKYCRECRHKRALNRLAEKWKTDEAYRARHRIVALNSFHKMHNKSAE